MIPNDQPLRGQIIERMINVISGRYESLTKWECDFIDSIAEQFHEKGNLSLKQCEILERLYDR